MLIRKELMDYYWWWLIALVLVLGTVFFTMERPEPIRNLPLTGGVVLVLGQDLAAGAGLSQLDKAYPAQLAQALGRRVEVRAKVGETSYGMLERLGKELQETRPNLVIVELGANDERHGIPNDTSLQNLSRIIDDTQKTGAAVLFLNQDPPNMGWRFRHFRNRVHQLGVMLVADLMEGIWGNPKMLTADGRPNEVAHHVLAERLAGAIRGLLKDK